MNRFSKRQLAAVKSNSLAKINRRHRRPVTVISQVIAGWWLTPEQGNDGYQIVGLDELGRVLLAGGYFLTFESVVRSWYVSEVMPTGYWPGAPSKKLAARSATALDELIERKQEEHKQRLLDSECVARNLPLLNKGVPA